MSNVTCQISISLDGYAAGPNQTPQEPLGKRGEELHQWMFPTEAWKARHGERTDVDAKIGEQVMDNLGAFVMGRNMFAGPGPGPWDADWKGWWGDNPPYHAPVFVLTHHPRDPIPMEGGTTFHFVTDGIESALERARAAAGDRDVGIAGGAQTVQQYLAAGLLDEMHLHIAPVLLGDGERLLENVGSPELEPVEVIASPAATHIRYRVVRS